VKLKFAEAEPVDCGVNFAVKETLFPAAIVTGKEIPDNENSELVTLAADTTTLAPEALNDPVCVALDPTVTLPKLKDPGVTLSDPAAAAEPKSGMVKFGTVDATEMLPLAAFVLLGVKVTFSVMLCPAESVSGSPGPLSVN
jgi:hypothetical protein